MVLIKVKDNVVNFPKEFVEKNSRKNFYFSQDEDEPDIVYLVLTKEQSKDVHPITTQIKDDQLVQEIENYFSDKDHFNVFIFSSIPTEENEQELYRIFVDTEENRAVVNYMDRYGGIESEILGEKNETSEEESRPKRNKEVKVDKESGTIYFHDSEIETDAPTLNDEEYSDEPQDLEHDQEDEEGPADKEIREGRDLAQTNGGSTQNWVENKKSEFHETLAQLRMNIKRSEFEKKFEEQKIKMNDLYSGHVNTTGTNTNSVNFF